MYYGIFLYEYIVVIVHAHMDNITSTINDIDTIINSLITQLLCTIYWLNYTFFQSISLTATTNVFEQCDFSR